MHFLATDAALGEFPVRREPCLFRCQGLVFVDHPAATFGGVASSGFPRVRGDHFAELLLTLFAHHGV